MTEDDTFNALRKWSYEAAIHHWWSLGSKGSAEELLKQTGWTYVELSSAYVAHISKYYDRG